MKHHFTNFQQILHKESTEELVTFLAAVLPRDIPKPLPIELNNDIIDFSYHREGSILSYKIGLSSYNENLPECWIHIELIRFSYHYKVE